MDTPRGFCQCGCGARTRIADKTSTRNGAIRGEPRKYVKGHGRTGKTKERYVVDPETGCWVWQLWTNPEGYGYTKPRGSRKNILAHRLYFMQARGFLPEGPLDHLCHTYDQSCPGGRDCRHRRCVNPDHLAIVTAGENVLRARRTKLSEADVKEARRMRADGALWNDIAKYFGVARPTVINRCRQP